MTSRASPRQRNETGDLFERPHIAKGSIVSERPPGLTFQPCALCGAPLVSVQTGSGQALPIHYATGECVGDGCPGPSKSKRGRDHDRDDD